jgi:hypothetical protein
MDDNSQESQAPGMPANKAELLRLIHASRTALEKTLNGLNEAQLTAPGPEGWSIRDHLAHLAAWEQGMVELLHRRNRFAAMQVEDAIRQGKSENEINALIYKHHMQLTLPQVLERFQDVHRQMIEAIEGLSEAELFGPYDAFLPEQERGNRPQPVINWIMGNTYQHFDEHRGYIKQLLG